MRHRLLALSVLVLSSFIFIFYVIWLANRSYPLVGHDFDYFIPRLIDVHLHYMVNGFSIQWYTPSFAGGLPAYPNPQHTQFMLAQLYTLVVNPWWATLAASATYIFLGFITAYIFFENVVGLGPLASVLGAIFFNVNGFIISHTIVGHLGYQAFPLLPALLIALTYPGWPPLIRGMVVSFLAAILVYSGGFYLIVIFGLSLLIVFPVLFLVRPALFSLRDMSLTVVWSSILTVFLTGSKVFAVFSFMRFFPRQVSDHFNVGLISGLKSVALQLFGAMTIIPVLKIQGLPVSSYADDLRAAVGTTYGLWELDLGISPALFAIIFLGLIFSVPQVSWPIQVKKGRLVALAVLGMGLWLVFEFRLTYGLMYPWLRMLPVLSSLHINSRFASAFLFFLALVGALIFERFSRLSGPAIVITAFWASTIITLAALMSYTSIPPYNMQANISAIKRIYPGIEAGRTYPITTVIEDDIPPLRDLLRSATNLVIYEPIFGYEHEHFQPGLETGDVYLIRDGYYNMTNPSGFVFPELNDTFPFEPIKVEDREKLEAFVNRRQPEWRLPLAQKVLDVIAALTLFVEAFVFVLFLFRPKLLQKTGA